MTMQGTKQNSGGIVGFVDDLNGAIRESPVAAGLIGMGVLWMLFGSERIFAATRSVTNAVGAASEATGSVVGDALAGTASRVSEVAHQVGDAIASSAEGAASVVLDKASATYEALKQRGEGAATVATKAKETGRSSLQVGRDIGISIQRNLTNTLEGQPLLLGVIGVAIGAGIASAFPSTKMEQDIMGEAGAAAKDKIQEIAFETSERAKDVYVEVKKEALAQGLTPASAGESLKGVATKVKTAASSSRESFKDRLS